jgi:RNA polymerase sigma-70 factor, ECF subfamily
VTENTTATRERTYLDLVARYESAILRYLYRIVGDADTAEDLTQETYLKAYRALGQLEMGDAAEVRRRAWLYRIAHNTATDHLRRRARRRWLSLDGLRGVASDDRPAAAVALEPVRQALGAISEEHRAVIHLFAEVGLTAAEAAEVLGISEAAARKRRQRAREAFEAAYLAAGGDA